VAELKEPEQPPSPAATATVRQILSWVGLVALVASAIVASNMFSLRDELFGSAIPDAAPPVASRDVFTPVQATPSVPTALRSQPWWQAVKTLGGAATTSSATVTIGRTAIQWRATARCSSGRIVVEAAGQPKPIIDAACSANAVGEAPGTGAMRVDVQTEGPWSLKVEQQIDEPLLEPPLAAMAGPGAKKAATGSFYRIAKTGTGTVAIYRQADGRYSLRLDHFFVSPTSDLELRLSTRRAPRSSREYLGAPSRRVAVMDVTAGSLNYVVPAAVDPTKFRSIVIWCPATAQAYAAASLETT